MSAPIVSTATHLPGQALEVCRALQAAEAALPVETRPDNISMSIDTEGNSITVTMTLPITSTGSANGVVYTASDYLV